MAGRLLGRAVIACLTALLGVGVGICTVGVHATGWGLVLGLAATAATLVALGGGWWRRFAFATGWSAAVLVLSASRTEGDYLVAGDLVGYGLLIAVPLVFVGAWWGFGTAPTRTRSPATVAFTIQGRGPRFPRMPDVSFWQQDATESTRERPGGRLVVVLVVLLVLLLAGAYVGAYALAGTRCPAAPRSPGWRSAR
ncbi:hypothetical protein [Nocardioides sambongensis]|uniref:hypothetical protein n=1 Tax=Nocardioides sambongensis TaxID=2589074 RepID=UPI00112B5602|nr:hypothetical protein [Nocardioides sambongensis]